MIGLVRLAAAALVIGHAGPHNSGDQGWHQGVTQAARPGTTSIAQTPLDGVDDADSNSGGPGRMPMLAVDVLPHFHCADTTDVHT